MSTGRHIDRVCILAVVVALVVTILFVNGAAFGIQAQAKTIGYEDRLFDTTRVHTIDILIDDWDGFLQTAQSEEYSVCNVVIDGEAFKNVGIRGKGNTSLSTVSSMNSERYSFKIEFDQYDSTKSYYGLDKLSLNNLIQDNTMMKDYLTYQMMNAFGVASPLCSYVYITVNGEDWGLYLAVEAVEESFLQRNYGSNYGDLYKPDSLNMGGGRGNGKDFDMSGFMEQGNEAGVSFDNMPSMEDVMGGMEFDPSFMGEHEVPMEDWEEKETMPDMGGFGMGSGETRLQYQGEDPESYSTIFSSAKTDVTSTDQTRLIAALKDLSEGKDSAVDVESVIRYFVVHNFVVNGDSYTGSMVHNYYLYEEDGQLSMIPWDYNLAFGTFQGGSAASAVNDDIDAPLSVTGSGLPMIDWIFQSDEYTELYHQYFQKFLNTVDIQAIITNAKTLITPYVEEDPTKFCSYEEFEKGVETLSAFCSLRSQSVSQQLAGGEADVDASAITLSDMGTMSNGFGGGKGFTPGMPGRDSESTDEDTQAPSIPDNTSSRGDGQMPQMPGGQGGMQMFGQGEVPQMTELPNMEDSTSAGETTGGGQQIPGFGNQGGMAFPEGMEMPEGMTLPEGMSMPEGMEIPEDMEIPGGREEMFSGQSGNFSGNFLTAGQGTEQTTEGAYQWCLLGASILILAIGLLVAFKFKR